MKLKCLTRKARLKYREDPDRCPYCGHEPVTISHS